MPIYEQTPIRLQLNLASNPPVDPVDANTGLFPRCWRGASVALQIGAFDAAGVPINMSNLIYLQLVIQESSDALVPSIVKTVQAADITSLSANDWIRGEGQQATFVLTPADTDQGLLAQKSRTFWCAVQGKTTLGNIVTYGAGTFIIYNAGVIMPSPLAGYVSLDVQDNNAGNTIGAITSNQHTQVVNVGGVARIGNIILPVNGIAAGAICRLLVNLPNTPNVIMQVLSGSLLNPVISTITSGIGILTAAIEYYFDYENQTWVPYSGNITTRSGLPVTDNAGAEITDSSGNAITTT